MRIIGFVLQFWGLLQLVVRIVEEAGDENGWSGAEKLMHAKLLVEWLATKFNISLPATFWKSLEEVISTVVNILNLLGIFKHKSGASSEEREAARAASVPPAATAVAARVTKTLDEYKADAVAEFERLTGRSPTVLAP